MPAKEQCLRVCPAVFSILPCSGRIIHLGLALTALEGIQLYVSKHCEMPNLFYYQRAASLNALSVLTGNEAWHSQTLMPREGNYLALSYR